MWRFSVRGVTQKYRRAEEIRQRHAATRFFRGFLLPTKYLISFNINSTRQERHPLYSDIELHSVSDLEFS